MTLARLWASLLWLNFCNFCLGQARTDIKGYLQSVFKSKTRIGKEFEKSPSQITGCQAGCSSFAPSGLVAHAFFATQSHPLLPIEVLILPLLFSYSLQKGLATFHHVFLSWISPLNPNTKQWLSFLIQHSPHNPVWHFTPVRNWFHNTQAVSSSRPHTPPWCSSLTQKTWKKFCASRHFMWKFPCLEQAVASKDILHDGCNT